ncbi:MAG TPA: PIN domain-containing protein [Candidatus Paceibacterota bacterium]|nr:PIN domain-containing protein [Verrucomicrobiota bacterium]HOX02664.1 PIN domain-containing protein [Verrucomicrobiota bacterium]HRZ44395.1 PIN domain-containing protein [Candidatus Paceibacterota bacterium]HRZ55748.1 PIN domain-containing protein [Candidatus Paceibacterota bacterium]
MTHGIDTDFLVAVEIRDHPFHRQADALLRALLADGHDLAVAPQTLAEFIHISTDRKRMPQPLAMTDAIARAEQWWQAAEVVRVFPDGQTVTDFLSWMVQHQLGRKRLLDTLLAATFHRAGVRRIITNNAKHFRILGAFEIVTYRG